MSATLPALPHARAVSAVSIMSTASIMSAARASASPAHAGARGADAPATPDADEARRAAERELARPEYRDESLLGRLWRWLSEHLNLRGVVPAGPDWLSILIVVVIALALVTVLILLLTRITRVQRIRTGHDLFEDDDRDSAALNVAADGAAVRGDWTTAIVERFRAIIRSLDERGAIDDYPGMTAHEAAAAAYAAVVDHADDLLHAGTLFDAVRYGEVVSTPAQDSWMRTLADAVAHAHLAPQTAPMGIPAWGDGGLP